MIGCVKKRIDQILVEGGLAVSRQKARALVLAGQVLVDDQKVDKVGRTFTEHCRIRVLEEMPYASRAGIKLAAALDHFAIDVAGRICADLGASTGGFTDCLLQRGARSVHAFDVGRGQLAWKLRTDSRVTVRDKFNVRNIRASDLPPGISLVTADLSFISLTKILEPLRLALLNASPAGRVLLVLLVKPQFEVGKGEVGKGGIVRDPEKRRRALEFVESFAVRCGYRSMGSVASPLGGSKGNQEFLLYLQLDAGL